MTRRWQMHNDGELWSAYSRYQLSLENLDTASNKITPSEREFWRTYFNDGILTLREELTLRGWL